MRRSDYDTKVPSTADFHVEDIKSHVFVHYAGVIAVWGEVADIGVRGVSPSATEIERLTDSLCTWIAELPEKIRLFDSSGSRQEYHQSISELHMVYFVTVILLEALSIKRHEQWSTSTTAIVAASSVARLIEEVDCWEDLSSMSSTTTFYVMAAAIPLIYHRPHSADRRASRQEGLSTLCLALERMSPRWGGASVCRQNIERIRNVVERHATQQQQKNQQQNDGSEQVAAAATNSDFIPARRYRHQDLFPFPETLCLEMALLSPSVDELLDISDSMLPLGDETLSWAYGEPQLYLDLFRQNMYSEDAFNLVNEAFGSLNPIDAEP